MKLKPTTQYGFYDYENIYVKSPAKGDGFLKFPGQKEFKVDKEKSKLYLDAIMYGKEITEKEYAKA